MTEKVSARYTVKIKTNTRISKMANRVGVKKGKFLDEIVRAFVKDYRKNPDSLPELKKLIKEYSEFEDEDEDEDGES